MVSKRKKSSEKARNTRKTMENGFRENVPVKLNSELSLNGATKRGERYSKRRKLVTEQNEAKPSALSVVREVNGSLPKTVENSLKNEHGKRKKELVSTGNITTPSEKRNMATSAESKRQPLRRTSRKCAEAIQYGDSDWSAKSCNGSDTDYANNSQEANEYEENVPQREESVKKRKRKHVQNSNKSSFRNGKKWFSSGISLKIDEKVKAGNLSLSSDSSESESDDKDPTPKPKTDNGLETSNSIPSDAFSNGLKPCNKFENDALLLLNKSENRTSSRRRSSRLNHEVAAQKEVSNDISDPPRSDKNTNLKAPKKNMPVELFGSSKKLPHCKPCFVAMYENNVCCVTSTRKKCNGSIGKDETLYFEEYGKNSVDSSTGCSLDVKHDSLRDRDSVSVTRSKTAARETKNTDDIRKLKNSLAVASITPKTARRKSARNARKNLNEPDMSLEESAKVSVSTGLSLEKNPSGHVEESKEVKELPEVNNMQVSIENSAVKHQKPTKNSAMLSGDATKTEDACSMDAKDVKDTDIPQKHGRRKKSVQAQETAKQKPIFKMRVLLDIGCDITHADENLDAESPKEEIKDKCQNRKSNSQVPKNQPRKSHNKGRKKQSSDSESSESEWEAVDDHDLDDYQPDIPEEGVTVTLKSPEIKKYKPKKKDMYDRMERIRLKINKGRRAVQVTVHQVHLLCLVAHAQYLNRTLNEKEVRAFALSIIPIEFHRIKAAKLDIGAIKKLLKWFTESISFENRHVSKNVSMGQLCKSFTDRSASSIEEFTMMFLVVFRCLGLPSRFCASLQPISFKGATLLKKPKRFAGDRFSFFSRILEAKRRLAVKKREAILSRANARREDDAMSNISSENCASKSTPNSADEENSETRPRRSNVKVTYQFNTDTDHDDDNDKDFNMKNENEDDSRDAAETYSTFKKNLIEENERVIPETGCEKVNEVDGIISSSTKSGHEVKTIRRSVLRKDLKRNNAKVDQMKAPGKANVSKSRPKRKSASKKVYKFSSDESDFDDDDKDKDFCIKEGEDGSSDDEDDDIPAEENDPSEDEFIIENLDIDALNTEELSSKCDNKKASPSTTKRKYTPRSKKLPKKGIDSWIEVYSSTEKRWICVQCIDEIIDDPYAIEKAATRPLGYVIAVDSMSCIKDVTKRYSCNWLTQGRKLQASTAWWEKTLEPFSPKDTKADQKETAQIEAILRAKPMPTKKTEFRDHPFYALKSQIWFLDSLYPPDVPPLGFFEGDPIYPRECIHRLRTRNSWYKEARVVRADEKPYKIITGPKWDRAAHAVLHNQPYEFYGKWQTDPYVPRVASGGKIPRNEYGNVELFKSDMLPAGTVHLRLPGLNRIANKLGIDCCPAVVGFKGYTRSPHAVYDGFVICKEHKNAVVNAWREEQEKSKRRHLEKKQKQIHANWKRLIKGLSVREKLRSKYGVELKSDEI